MASALCPRHSALRQRADEAGASVKAAEIYEALFDDEALARLPDALARAGRARSAMMLWRHLDGGVDTAGYNYFDPQMMEDYAKSWSEQDPWVIGGVRSGRLNQMVLLHDYVSPVVFDRTVFFNEFVRRHHDDTFHCAGGIVHSAWGQGIVSVQRGRSQQPFDEDDRRRLQLTAKHVERVIRARGEVAAARRLADHANRSLDSLALASITVNGEGLILHANAAAERALRRADRLLARKGRLICTSLDTQKRLDLAIQRATSPSDPCADALRIGGGPEEPAYLATITPLVTLGKAGTAVLFFREPARNESQDSLPLRRLFGLTPSEAHIALDVAAGRSPAEIAQARGVTLATLRSQLKAIMAKMQCSRQTEVAAIVARLLPISGSPSHPGR